MVAVECMSQITTISESIYQSLKDDIINLDLDPGRKISEQQIAQHFGVSRAPVRTALQRLRQDGLVQIKPQSGTTISPLPSITKAREICQVRLLLEPYAAECAAKVITEEQKTPLRNFANKVEQSKPLIQGKTALLHEEADALIHPLIWKLSGNQEIVTILSSYSDEMKRIQHMTAMYAARIPKSLDEMININNALIASDSQKCRETMYQHIENIKNALQSLMEN